LNVRTSAKPADRLMVGIKRSDGSSAPGVLTPLDVPQAPRSTLTVIKNSNAEYFKRFSTIFGLAVDDALI
jgi:hypothetical protein